MKISIEYLRRESVNPGRSVYWISEKGESVYDWLLNYLKRNKIEHEIDSQISIKFKSQRQESVNPGRSVYWISEKGESVYDCVLNYLKRNKIEHEIDSQISIKFKSQRQRNVFLLKGNRIFPYFEFL